MGHHRVLLLGCLLMAVLAWAPPVVAAEGVPAIPTVSIGIEEAADPGQVSLTVQILILLTVLSLAPALALMTTSFTRILIVLGFLRNAMGIQQLPPNQVVVTLALFLTLFIMRPVWENIYTEAYVPYQAGEIETAEAIDRTLEPIREFMFTHTRDEELSLMVSLSESERPEGREDVSLLVLLPAFMLSELKTAFQMGVVLFVPFLVIDMIVASVLMAMGMIMLPPMLVSLPFKVLLFVLADGWDLVVVSLIESFR